MRPFGGLGIAYLPSFLYAEAMREGLLEDAIPEFCPSRFWAFYAVYPPGRFIQPKVRSFIDFLVDEFREKGTGRLVGCPPVIHR